MGGKLVTVVSSQHSYIGSYIPAAAASAARERRLKKVERRHVLQLEAILVGGT